jgi:hypothetical protein
MLLLATLMPRAMAQVGGEVESLGLGGYYRPDSWIPVVVTLTPQTADTDNYLLRIRQEDMDRDHPVFTRLTSVTGAAPDHPAGQQHFRTYFKASPIGGGLIDPGDATAGPELTAQQVLARQLPVELWSSSMKLITRLPLTSSLQSVDGKPTGFDTHIGRRMILAVRNVESPPHNEYDIATGMLEQVLFVPVRVSELPESATGYDGVDAVLWLDADPADLHAGGDEKYRALQQFVRGGGHLVICQSPQWQRTAEMGELLPVVLSGTRIRSDAGPLGEIARRGLHDSVLEMPQQSRDAGPGPFGLGSHGEILGPDGRPRGMPVREGDTTATLIADTPAIEQWQSSTGPFTLGIAKPAPGSYVQLWATWPGKAPTPYLVRRVSGAGAVTWVAQDLASPELAALNSSVVAGDSADETLRGWPFIYQAVFDWKDKTRLVDKAGPNELTADRLYAPAADSDDFSYALLDGMELPGRSAALVGLAFAFFIGYWILAGPGGFGFLVVRQRQQQSWALFAGTALVATLATVALVKLVLGGAPELRHISVVRIAPNEPATVYSRFGLYIPRDGRQRLELAAPAEGWSSAMSAFAIHPLLDNEFPDDNGPDYDVPVQDEAADGPLVLNVPYRSTLKRFEAQWAGDLPQYIQGTPVLGAGAIPVSGVLKNKTGKTLTDVFIAVKGAPKGAGKGELNDSSGGGGGSDDYLLYLPQWDAEQAIDLAQEFRVRLGNGDAAADLQEAAGAGAAGGAAGLTKHSGGNPLVGPDNRPGPDHAVVGRIEQDWQPFWTKSMPNRGLGGDSRVTDPMMIVPMLSFFSRIPPMRADPDTLARYELRRLGLRRLDVSAAVATGAVVVVASVHDDPLPIPLTVQGEPVAGSGWTIYQFVLPADTTVASTPATQPSGASSPAGVSSIVR